MLKGLGQLASLMRGAGELSEKMEGLQRSLQEQTVTGSAGGGLVTVTMNGLGQVTSVALDPSLTERGDREMIENLLPAAVNQASARAKELHLSAMRELTGGIELPGIDKIMAAFRQDESDETDSSS
jgi:DNA-binding YbaB/EbfC family protein